MNTTTRVLAGALAIAAILGQAWAFAGAPAPEIRISDVELFYRVYDAAHGTPSAQVLQRDYLDAGSPGLRQFIPHRIVSAEKLAEKIAADRPLYAQARACAAQLPDVRARVAAALTQLGELLPDARYPPITIVIGRGNTGGTTGKSGVLIGLETICSADWMQPALDDRLVHLLAHEYVHVQQPIVQRDEDPTDGTHTVLEASLVEGGADFVAELISGSASNAHLQRWTAGHEREIAADFLREKDSTDLSHWLYNGHGTPRKPGDLGYWVGYRIAKAFYQRATDKPAALRQLLAVEDPQKILAQSGWPDAER